MPTAHVLQALRERMRRAKSIGLPDWNALRAV
jgi:hypothetical protein